LKNSKTTTAAAAAGATSASASRPKEIYESRRSSWKKDLFVPAQLYFINGHHKMLLKCRVLLKKEDCLFFTTFFPSMLDNCFIFLARVNLGEKCFEAKAIQPLHIF